MPRPVRRACWVAASSVPRCRKVRSIPCRRSLYANCGWPHEVELMGGAMTGARVEAYSFDKNDVEKSYAGWAPIYDVVFGAVFAAGREAAVVGAGRVGGG